VKGFPFSEGFSSKSDIERFSYRVANIVRLFSAPFPLNIVADTDIAFRGIYIEESQDETF